MTRRTLVPLALLLALAAPSWAASPVVAQRYCLNDDSLNTTNTFTLPSPLNSTDLVIIAAAFTSGSTTPDATWPAGWTLVRDWNCNSASGQCFESIYRRVADGTEGASISVTTVANRKSAYCVWRITGQAASGTILIETIAAGSGANANPSGLNPGVTRDYLAIVTGAWNTNLTGINITEPSGYTANIDAATSVQTVTCAGAEKSFTGSSEDPGAWTHGSVVWATSTILVYPVATGARRRIPGLVRAPSVFDWFLMPRAYAAEARMGPR